MLNKNLHLCFTRPTTSDSSPTSEHQDPFNHSSSNIITSSPPTRTTTATTTTTAAATTSCSSSSNLIKNFNSLYDNTPASTSNSLSRTSDDFSTSDSETDQSTTPDFATIFASQRFFFSSPGRSNSIVESSSSTCQSQSSLSDSPPESSSSSSDTLVAGGVPTPTYSPDPYIDFRRSMQEMVEDRKLSDVTTDWDFLHELLLCYLALNPKHAHKYIIGAFADLLISLMASDDSRRREQSDNISSRRQ